MLDRIRAAARLVVEHFPLLGGIAAIWFVPVTLVEVFLLQQATRFEEKLLFWPLYLLLLFGLGSLCFGALIQAQGRLCLNERISIGRAFRDASETWDKLFAALLIVSMLVAFGSLFFLLPGIYLAVKYQFTAHVVALEDLDSRAARKRSWHLSNGVGWEILGTLLLFGLGVAALRFLIALAAGPVYTESLLLQFVVFSLSGIIMVVPFTAIFLCFWQQREQESKLERLPEALLSLERDYRPSQGAGQ